MFTRNMLGKSKLFDMEVSHQIILIFKGKSKWIIDEKVGKNEEVNEKKSEFLLDLYLVSKLLTFRWKMVSE